MVDGIRSGGMELSTVRFGELWAHPVVRSAVVVATSAVIIWLLVKLAKRIIRTSISDNSLRYSAGKFVGVFGYAVLGIVIAIELSGRFSGLTVAIGAASAGVAFALQESIASFAGWLAVAFGSSYKVGDRVQLGGIRGDVIDIGFLRTTIMECGAWVQADLYNGRIVRIANSFVLKEPVYNYSGEFSFLWDEIVVPIKYGSDYKQAKAILLSAAVAEVGNYAEGARSQWQQLVRSYRIEDAQIEPVVTMTANDNWVELTLRYIVDYRKRRSTKDALFSRILEGIEASAGRVSIASVTVALVHAPKLDVRLADKPAPAGPASREDHLSKS